MGFRDCEPFAIQTEYVSLKADGDAAEVVFLAEPVPRTTHFGRNRRQEFVFPVATENGVQALTVGVRTYRSIRDRWNELNGKPCLVVRHGAKGSRDTWYEIKPADVADAVIASMNEATDDDIAKCIKAATKDNVQPADEIPY